MEVFKMNTAGTSNHTDRRDEDRRLIYQLDGRPRLRTALPLGMQHVLAMFTSNLAPILIIAGACNLSAAQTVIMVQCAMFVSGLTTFIQLSHFQNDRAKRKRKNVHTKRGAPSWVRLSILFLYCLIQAISFS